MLRCKLLNSCIRFDEKATYFCCTVASAGRLDYIVIATTKLGFVLMNYDFVSRLNSEECQSDVTPFFKFVDALHLPQHIRRDHRSQLRITRHNANKEHVTLLAYNFCHKLKPPSNDRRVHVGQ